ncbi:MAG: chitinase [Gammaproteobacteria bacterium]|nr:chitinase [Gammaproteobacteria bacterium]
MAALSIEPTQTYTVSPYADLTLNVHWDATQKDLAPADLSEISQASSANSFHLAFITDAGTCDPAWGGQAAYAVNTAWGKRMIDTMHSNKLNVVIAFGGATGNDISLACSTTQLVSAYEKVINTYQADAIDFDIENGTANIEKIMTALKQIQHSHPNLPISFTLPVMPEGLASVGREAIKTAASNDLDFTVNIMAMDYGPSYNGDMGQYAIVAATNLFDFLKSLYPQKTNDRIWHMIEVTPMIGVNDVSTEQFTLQNVDTLSQFAKQKGLKSLSFWSLSRDFPCADKWTNTNCSSNNLQTNAYEYTRQFMKQTALKINHINL